MGDIPEPIMGWLTSESDRQKQIGRLNSEIVELRKQVARRGRATPTEIEKQLIARREREINELRATHLGLWGVRRRVNAQGVAGAFLSLHISAMVAGAILIFQKSPLKELGIALVVGGLFGMGALLGQVWSEVYENERDWRKGLQQTYEEERVPLKRELDTLLLTRLREVYLPRVRILTRIVAMLLVPIVPLLAIVLIVRLTINGRRVSHKTRR